MEKVKAWALAHRRIIGGVVLGVLLAVIAVLLFRGCKTEPQKVTVEPQSEAQTETGVEKAADKAQVPVSRQQAQAAQERAGADFSIVASGDGEKADVASIGKDKPVELNQYNVQAYKRVLHTVEASPDIEGGRGIAEVGYSVSRKVSRDGKYLGVGASYNFDNDKAYVKMTYTW